MSFTSTTTYPYDTVVRITGVLDGVEWFGSGVLIAPDEVLTASHVVYHQGEGTISEITVTPGYNDATAPYSSATANYIHYFPVQDADDLISEVQSQDDIAVLHLTTSFSSLGTMGLLSDYAGGQVNVTGYPVSANGAQVQSTQTVVQDPLYTLLDGTAIGQGSSGGPVWVDGSAGPQVVGVVSSGSLGGPGYFTQLTPSLFDDIQQWVASDNASHVSPTPTPGPNGLIGLLTVPQQLEMIYVAYFNRAADGAGFNFWQGQNTAAVAAGQSTGQVLAEIANSFTPQPETFALYPFLSTPNLNLESPASVTGLTNVVTAIYDNLFDRAPDAAGLSYWVDNLSTGAIPLGEAILAIANGALGSDVTEILNKITVALDFTTRTGAAGSLVNAPASLLPAARSVLHGVDSTSLNDASVTAGENATTAYISGTTTNSATAAVASLTADSDTIIVSNFNTVEDPGTGSHTIQFIAGASVDTVVLHSGGTDQIAGFDLAGGDVLDVRTLLAEAHLTAQGVLPNLGAYFTIADQGSNAVLRFDSTGHGGGNAVAILDDLGSVVTSLSSLMSHNAVQI
jgi:V8-like Glu-specific endopeptidase